MQRRRRMTAVGTCLVGVVLVGCSGPPVSTSVATPPPDASPEHVVQAMIDAVNAGDLEMVRYLGQGGSSGFEWWVENGASMRDAEILDTFSESLFNDYATYQDAVNVQVAFTPCGTDSSMPAGSRITWGFLLTDESGSWRVFDSGQG